MNEIGPVVMRCNLFAVPFACVHRNDVSCMKNIEESWIVFVYVMYIFIYIIIYIYIYIHTYNWIELYHVFQTHIIINITPKTDVYSTFGTLDCESNHCSFRSKKRFVCHWQLERHSVVRSRFLGQHWWLSSGENRIGTWKMWTIIIGVGHSIRSRKVNQHVKSPAANECIVRQSHAMISVFLLDQIQITE